MAANLAPDEKLTELPKTSVIILDDAPLAIVANLVRLHLPALDLVRLQLMIKRPFICTFNSQTNKWKSISPDPESSFKLRYGVQDPASFSIESVCCNGRIYVLEVVGSERGQQHVTARVYVVESRSWWPDVYTLYAGIMCGCMLKEGERRGPTLVACLGDVYAIVPILANRKFVRLGGGGAGLDLVYHVTGTVRFEVFKLQEEEKKFAFCVTSPLQGMLLLEQSRFYMLAQRPWSWYKCVSKGAVIWLFCEYQLLQYDVVTGRCKSLTVHINAFGGDNFMPYEPGFHVNP